MAKKSTARVISKKHIARLERERRQTRGIIYGSIAIIVLVLGMIAYGILNQTVIRSLKPILSVNGDVARVAEFETQAQVYRLELINQYKNVYIMAQMFGLDPNTDEYVNSLYSQINSQLSDTQSLGQSVVDRLIEIRLVRQYALVNDITVTDDEVEKAIQEAFRYYADGSPTPTLTATSLSFATYSSTQFALVSPTPTRTPTATKAPTSTPENSPTPTATLAAEPTATSTLAPTLTPTPFTLKAYEKAYDDYVKTYKIIHLSNSEYRQVYFADNLLREKVYNIVTKDVPHEQDMVWVRQIVVGNEESLRMVQMLMKLGVPIDSLIKRYAADNTSSSNGNQGWVQHGVLPAEVEEVAYSAEVGTTSDPIKSDDGWHIIQVLGHEVRGLTEDEYKTATDEAFNDWVAAQRETAEVVIYDYWPDYVPSTPTLQEVMLDYIYAQQTSNAEMQTQAVQTDAANP